VIVKVGKKLSTVMEKERETYEKKKGEDTAEAGELAARGDKCRSPD